MCVLPGRNGPRAVCMKGQFKGLTAVSGLKRFRESSSKSENLLIVWKHVTREDAEVGTYFRMAPVGLDVYLFVFG